MPSSLLDYRELVPVQEAAGEKWARQMYSLESAVGRLGKKLASSNSSKSWHGLSFRCMPRTAVHALVPKGGASSDSHNSDN